MSKIIDITGQRFGRLTVIKYHGQASDRSSLWFCQCDCGNTSIVRRGNLIKGKSTSCGCYTKERTRETNIRHNMSNSPIYFAWFTMKQRCFNHHSCKYKLYGARGITVCKDWKDDFAAFYEYVSKLPHFGEKGRTLDRIDDNGNYEPGNVRWATAKEQANNTRRNVFFEKDGQVWSPRKYADEHGLKYDWVYHEYIIKPRKAEKRKENKQCQ